MKTEHTVKMLQQQLKHVTDPKLKKQIEAKIDALTNHKEVTK